MMTNKRKIRVVIVDFLRDASSMRDIDVYARRLGYLRTPYHFAVYRDNRIEEGRPVEDPSCLDETLDREALGVVMLGAKWPHKEHYEQVKKIAQEYQAEEILWRDRNPHEIEKTGSVAGEA